MAENPKRKWDFSYLKILSREFQQIPAWKELALACDEILGAEVDERRRKLELIRDSTRYRRGDVLVNVKYEPTPNRPAVFFDTREPVEIPTGYKISTANVINVIKNLAYLNHPDNKDYLELEFTYKDRVTRWLKPFDSPQERDALLKNAYIMGFDFFNTKLSDEDLERLYQFVQLYWNESGTDDNFMKFIGFIKNARFDLVPLWSYEDENIKTYDDLAANPDKDVYPVLEPKPRDALTIEQGGSWYLTSHVEIHYDLSQFGDFYTLNLDDLETLFYYFAPIILVLERIVGTLDVEVDYGILTVSDLTIENYSVTDIRFDGTVAEMFQTQAAGLTIINYSKTQEETDFILPNGQLIGADSTLINGDIYSVIDPNTDPGFTLKFSLCFPDDQTIYNHSNIDFIKFDNSLDSFAYRSATRPNTGLNFIQNYGVFVGSI